MDVGQRLAAVGLKKADFAERLGVGASTISNWIQRGTLSDEAEALLGKLEGTGGKIPVGCLVDTDEGPGRVVRKDVCHLLDGRIEHVYWVGIAAESREPGQEGLWKIVRGAHQFPEHFLRKPREVKWVEKSTRDIGKG